MCTWGRATGLGSHLIDMKTMTTIRAQIKGKQKDLEMVKSCGLFNYSQIHIGVSKLTVDWISEEASGAKALESVMYDFHVHEVETWGCELISFEIVI